MSYFNRTLVFAIAAALALLIPALVMAQSPPVPDKSPGIPSKTTPLASPQAALASPQQSLVPQQSFAPQYDQPAVVLRAVPQIYQVQRQVILQAAPVVAYAAPVASYALADVGCVAQQQVVVQRNLIQHSAIVNHGFQSAVVNHGVIAGAGRQPRAIKTKQKTRIKRGLFGG